MTGPGKEGRDESTRIYLDFIDSQDERDVDVALVVVWPSGVIQLFDSLTREAVKWGVQAVLRARRRKSDRQRQEIVFVLLFVVADSGGAFRGIDVTKTLIRLVRSRLASIRCSLLADATSVSSRPILGRSWPVRIPP